MSKTSCCYFPKRRDFLFWPSKTLVNHFHTGKIKMSLNRCLYSRDIFWLLKIVFFEVFIWDASNILPFQAASKSIRREHIFNALIKICKKKRGEKIVGKKRDNLNLLFLPRGQLPNYLNLISLLFTAISKCKNSVFHIRTTEHWFSLVEFFPP